jgi:hypothetical protein
MGQLSGTLVIAIATSAVVGFVAGYQVAENISTKTPRTKFIPLITTLASVLATVAVTYLIHTFIN